MGSSTRAARRIRPRARLKRSALGSALFLVVAPGTVAVLIPWLITGWESKSPPVPLLVLGALLIAAGLPVLLHSFARFVTEGRGTPAPVAPPTQLVVGGFYRWVRNPMYVAVASLIAGQALLLGRIELLVYLAVFLVTVVSFVRGYEEPALSEQFGEDYERYCAAVPGWWPTLRPYPRSDESDP